MGLSLGSGSDMIRSDAQVLPTLTWPCWELKSPRLSSTAPDRELTAVVIVIIVSCSIFVCGNVVILVAFALDEPWYILIT